VIGTAGTATSYGGLVAKVNGGNLPSALGYNAVVTQSATLSTLSDGVRQLVLVGNTNWAGLSIGDLVELYSTRDIATGATIGVDGTWKVAAVATTSLTLVLPYAGSMVIPADFASVNCGGAVIKRTDMRISFMRMFDYTRDRVEMLARPATDLSAAVPVAIQGGTLPAVTTVGTVTTVTGVTTVATVTNVTTAGTPLAPATPYFVNSLATTNIALILTGTSGLSGKQAISIGNTYLTDYSVEFAVGSIPTATVSLEASNIVASTISGTNSGTNPAIHQESGVSVGTAVVLPPPTSNTETASVGIPKAVPSGTTISNTAPSPCAHNHLLP
jgi:hypothetical protein